MSSNCNDFSQKLLSFLGGLPVKSLHQLLNSNDNGVAIVPGYFHSVLEGVDLWFGDEISREQPKFRMKMKLNDGDDVAVFVVTDDDVQKLAVETCPLMLALGESCSLFPDEMEVYYGDPFLCKVEKRLDADFENLPCFAVTSVCNDYGVVDMFFEQYLLDSDKNTKLPESELQDLSGPPRFYFSSCDSKESFDEVNSPDFSVESVIRDVVPLTDLPLRDKENEGSSSKASCFHHQTKKSKNGMSTYLETMVYSRRKNCVKRKLRFDDGVMDDASSSKISKVAGCEKI